MENMVFDFINSIFEFIRVIIQALETLIPLLEKHLADSNLYYELDLLLEILKSV